MLPHTPSKDSRSSFSIIDLIAIVMLFCLHMFFGKMLGFVKPNDVESAVAVALGSLLVPLLAAGICSRVIKAGEDYIYRMWLMVVIDVGLLVIPILYFLICVTGPALPALASVVLFAYGIERFDQRR